MAAATAAVPGFFGYTNTTSALGGRPSGASQGNSSRLKRQVDEFDKGDIVDGFVRHVNAMGVWLDIGGVDALLPESQVEGPRPLVGDEIKDLRVTEVDTIRRRLGVALLGSANSGGIYIYMGGTGGGQALEGAGLVGKRPLEDVRIGERVAGVVRAVVRIGAIVDVGVARDGLLYWDNVPPNIDVEKNARLENLVVIKKDVETNRLLLGMQEEVNGVLRPYGKGKGRGKGKNPSLPQPREQPLEEFQVGQEVSGTVKKNVIDVGVYIDIGVPGVRRRGASVTGLLSHKKLPPGAAFQKGSLVRGLYIVDVQPERKRLTLGLLGKDTSSSSSSRQARQSSRRQEWEQSLDPGLEAAYGWRPPPPPPAYGGRPAAMQVNSLRVGNLTEDIREQDLERLFRRFGEITRIHVAFNRETGEPRGFAFVHFVDKDEAQRAIDELDGYGYKSVVLRVGWAVTQKELAEAVRQICSTAEVYDEWVKHCDAMKTGSRVPDHHTSESLKNFLTAYDPEAFATQAYGDREAAMQAANESTSRALDLLRAQWSRRRQPRRELLRSEASQKRRDQLFSQAVVENEPEPLIDPDPFLQQSWASVVKQSSAPHPRRPMHAGGYAGGGAGNGAYGRDDLYKASPEIYGNGYEKKRHDAEGYYGYGGNSGKGGSTAYPSSISGTDDAENGEGVEEEEEEEYDGYSDSAGVLSSSDPLPEESLYHLGPHDRKLKRLRAHLPGKSMAGLRQVGSEPEAEGLPGGMAPGIRDLLARIQEPDPFGEPRALGESSPFGVEDPRGDAVDDGEGSVDDEEVAQELGALELGAIVDGTVTRVTEQGARVDFGCSIEGILPQRLIDWPVRVGDEVVDLVISRVDLEKRRVTLAVEVSEVDEEKVGAFSSSRAAVAKGAGRGGTGGGRGRGGGRGQGRGAGRDGERDDSAGDRFLDGAGMVDGDLYVGGDLQEVEQEVAPLLVKIYSGQRSAARQLAKAAAASRQPIQACFNASGALKVLMKFSNCAAAALLGIQELNEKLGRESEPFLARIIPAVLERYGDRQRSVQVAAEDAAETIIARLNPYGVDAVLPAVLKVLQRREKTDIKVGALRLLALMRDEDTIRPLARKLHEIIPYVVDMLNDVKKEVRTVAKETAKVLFECAQNRDLDPYLGDIITALMSQESIPACINQLSEIVFVQPVETQALAVIMPLIQRGLKDRDERTKRKALAVADNMCKLVPDVSEIHPFLSALIPLVKKAKEYISQREVLRVADGCLQTLDAANKAGCKKVIDKSAVHKILYERIPEEKHEVVTDITADYVADLCRTMSACRTFDHAEWWQCIAPYLTPHLLSKAECELLVLDLLENCYDAAEGDDVEDDDEEGDDLCNCVFSLGYGALTLLNNTRLHLKRGKCYGLCGPNDCGKSTLLRAINNEQVDGFPPKTELVTAFVEHGVGEKEPECAWTPLEYMFADETIQAMQIPKKKIVAALRSLGFDSTKLRSEIGTLSGGWKMKLGLVRAMLMCADILLLDEPTGHLDSSNMAWLGDYILGVKNDSSRPVTTIVVSHDTGFLDKVCTHIISIKQRKLKTYRGNITEFVRRQPDAKAYLSLVHEKSKFKLPEPGMLEGVKSRGKKLLRMHNVSYTYPNNEEPTLLNVSIEVSMLSRIAVIGPNGSGKSTLVKALVGELPLNHSLGNSSLWRHPNVRISYVAQHAFHHIEQHVDKTATEYILWRFAGGVDCEALGYKAEEVGRQRRPYFFKDGLLVRVTEDKDRAKAVEPEQVLGRQRAKRPSGPDEQYEYEVRWRNMPMESKSWVSREKLADMGALAMAQREDEKQAMSQGILARPLTQPQVEEHLLGFGLEPSFASHSRLGVLSGGQKVKVVMGAATWLSPHILILDEPTNYLDRESLGALAGALKEFSGGVIVVSHNREFSSTVCDERCVMDSGRLTREGQLEKQDVLIEHGALADEWVDEGGNVHQRSRSLKSDRDIKRQKRQKELRRKRGEAVSSDEEPAAA